MFIGTFALLRFYSRRQRIYKHFVPPARNLSLRVRPYNCATLSGTEKGTPRYFFLSVTRTGSPNLSNGISNS